MGIDTEVLAVGNCFPRTEDRDPALKQSCYNNFGMDQKMQKKMRATAINMAVLLLTTAVGLAAVEIFLRLNPSVISMPILAQMEPGLRQEIAKKIGLITVESTSLIPTEKRSDGGPPFRLPGPDSLTVTPADPADLAVGAVENVRVDRNGFCNDPQKAELGRAAVVVVGDSFTFCTAVREADTATSKLQGMLNEPVYNIGVRGMGPNEYVELLKMFASQFQPRIAVMNIYEGNDLRGLRDNRNFKEGKRVPKRYTELSTHRSSPDWSYALGVLRGGLKLVEKSFSGATPKRNFHYSAELAGKTVQMNVSNSDQDELVFAEMYANNEISFELYAPPLKSFVDWCVSQNIVPLVAYIPAMYTTYDANVQFEDEDAGSKIRNFSKAQRGWFSDNAAKVGYKYLDLTPDFQKAASEGLLTHFPSNVHLTPAGHEVVARGTFEFIKSELPGAIDNPQ